MVILALAFMAFGGLGRDEPRPLLQIHEAPFGLKQLADSAECAQADPQRALDARIDRANA